jgi:predicted dinucleotide-binding enzyme
MNLKIYSGAIGMILRKVLPVLATFCWLAGLLALPTAAETIAVIGTGNVAQALGPKFAEQGHLVIYGSRKPHRPAAVSLIALTGQGTRIMLPVDAVAQATIIVLAVPGLMVEKVVHGLGSLAGKIIIDPTNPLQKGSDGLFELSTDSSNAELIQALQPDADVVKAFNTVNWRTMMDSSSSGGLVSIPLVGNSDVAKSVVAKLVTGMGLEPIDLGSVKHARYLEGMLILWINNRFVTDRPFDYYLRKMPRS